MEHPSRQLSHAIAFYDVKAIDRILTSYPGEWGPPVDHGFDIPTALDRALLAGHPGTIDRLLQDSRSQPTNPSHLRAYTARSRADLIRPILPHLSQPQLDQWLGDLCKRYPHTSPTIRRMIVLGVRTGARMTEIGDAGSLCFSGHYPEIWWATLRKGESLWSTAPNEKESDYYFEPLPIALYQQTRARTDAAFGVAVGKDLTTYLWRAV